LLQRDNRQVLSRLNEGFPVVVFHTAKQERVRHELGFQKVTKIFFGEFDLGMVWAGDAEL
jgi:hypothetical protein